jgi:hypothetical protein
LILVYSVFFVAVCVATHHQHHTNYCTTLQPSISTHTHKHAKTHTNKHKNHNLCSMHYASLCLPALSVLLYVGCFSFFYPNSLCVLYVHAICIYVYMYCCFRYLNGVCPIRDGHRGQQDTQTQCFPLCRHLMMTPLRLFIPCP